MSTLTAKKLAARPFWLPRGATEHADTLLGVYYAGRRPQGSLAAHLLAGRWTLVRTSEASHTNASGLLAFAAANMPRLDHDPATLAPLGLLLEGTRTNLASYTEAFDNAYWPKTAGATAGGITVTANAVVAPDGETSADKIVETTGNLSHSIFKSTTWTATVFANSVFMKAGERVRGGPYWFDNGSERKSWFNLSTGAISANGIGTKRIYPAANGFFRCAVVRTPTAGSGRFGVAISVNDNQTSYVGDGVSGAYAWGIQVEPDFESSYIRETVGGSATRAADSLTRPTTQPARLAILFKVRTPVGVPSSDNQVIWSIGDATNGMMLRRSSTGHVFFSVYSGGVATANLDLGGVGGLGVHKIAIAHDGTSARACLNGDAVASATCTMPTLTTMVERLGSSAAGEGWFGHLQTATWFDALTDDAMLTHTAPPQYINALIGIDSLSDPASTGLGRPMRDIMWNRIGKASAGWIPLIFTSNARVDALNYLGVTNITNGTAMPGDDRTLDFQGQRWQNPNSGTAIATFTPREPYDQLDLVYVSNPGDGSFRFQAVGNGTATYDGDAAVGAKVVHVECFAAPNAAVRWDQFEDGNPNTVVGVNFSRAGAGGFTYNPFGNGGWKVQWLAAIDDAAMRTIVGAIKPTHFVFNGGMNDRADRTASQFDADCRKVLGNIVAAAPRCKIVILQSLEPSDAASSYFNSYIPVKQQLAIDYNAQFLDMRTINADTASYALANAAGHMQDAVHPATAFNVDIGAPWVCDNIAW